MWTSRRAGIGGVALALALVCAAPPAGAQAPPGPRLPIEVTGVTRAEFDDATGVARLEGAPLVATRGQTVVRASRARYDRRSGILTADGGVEASEPGLAIRAEAAEYRLDDEWVAATGSVSMTSAPPASGQPPVTLLAPEVAGSLRTRRFAATGGVTITRGEWTVAGRRADYAEAARTVVVTGDPQVRFAGGVMTAETLTMVLDSETMRAEGSVQMRRADLTGQAQRADVSLRAHVAILSGHARIDRGPDRITADVIETTLDGQRITARGASRLIVATPGPPAGPSPP
jgi:lipopolysaccharide export system protein LptA